MFNYCDLAISDVFHRKGLHLETDDAEMLAIAKRNLSRILQHLNWNCRELNYSTLLAAYPECMLLEFHLPEPFISTDNTSFRSSATQNTAGRLCYIGDCEPILDGEMSIKPFKLGGASHNTVIISMQSRAATSDI